MATLVKEEVQAAKDIMFMKEAARQAGGVAEIDFETGVVLFNCPLENSVELSLKVAEYFGEREKVNLFIQ